MFLGLRLRLYQNNIQNPSTGYIFSPFGPIGRFTDPRSVYGQRVCITLNEVCTVYVKGQNQIEPRKKSFLEHIYFPLSPWLLLHINKVFKLTLHFFQGQM